MSPNQKPNIFMSYSRREVSFVNNLVEDLENNDYTVWLDYRSLIPGTPWAGQIEKGIVESEVILLVVSKASMASEYVEMEWKRVLEQGKRVILVIFEAVDLPEELEHYEWVDFRGKYEDGLEELMRQIDAPEQEEHPAPETGFKVPRVVWVAVILSVIVGLMSLGSLWTLFIPFLLFPLPYRVFKREFSFIPVQAALIFLPLTLFMTSFFAVSDAIWDLTSSLAFASIPFVISLFFVFRSAAWQRWGKPAATMPKFANPYDPNNPNPEPTPFFVDSAPEDQTVAADLTKTLLEYGHPQVEDIHQAKAVFVLISNYNKTTEADPQKQVVFPILLQTTDNINEKLGKVQWIDFRNGVRDLHEIAQLLPNPEKLLRALGVRPMGNQLILPPVIQYLMYFIIALAVLVVGSWLPYILQYLPDIVEYADADASLIQLAISVALFIALSVFMVRAIVQRQGRLAISRNMWLALAGLGLLILWQNLASISIDDVILIDENDFRGMSALFPPVIYVLGNILMGIFLVLKRKDVRYWFLKKTKKSTATKP